MRGGGSTLTSSPGGLPPGDEASSACARSSDVRAQVA